MKRHRTASRKPAKTRHRNTTSPKRSIASKATRGASSSVTELQKQIERQARELGEAREQQTATSEVLKVISSSPGELQPVFEAMLESATEFARRISEVCYRWEGDALRVVPRDSACRSDFRSYSNASPSSVRFIRGVFSSHIGGQNGGTSPYYCNDDGYPNRTRSVNRLPRRTWRYPDGPCRPDA